MKIIKDLTGEKYNLLTVLEKTDKRASGKVVWKCICDCGTIVEATGNHLRNGSVKSCGCIMIKHGHSGGIGKKPSSTYSCWQMMHQRCCNPQNSRYKNYGGRGIRICERWADFEHFLEDMGERPEGKTLDRIDVNGNYEPSNCRWATNKEQQNNLTNNRKVNYKGEMITISKLAEILKIDRYILYARLNRAGWDVEKVERKIIKQ
jgi:hypothetical protein